MVVPVHPAGGCGFEVVAALPGAVAPERAPRLQGACTDEEACAEFQATGPALAGGLPRAWAAAPAQGGAHGFGRGDRCPRRRVARCRRWTGDLDPWSLWWTRPQGSPPSRCFRAPGRLFQGAGRALAPRARAGAPADDADVAHRPRDEGGATRNPVPGRHVGEVDHPAPVRTGRRRESRRARAERGPGSPWRAWWCAPSGPARRRSVPVPACAAPRCTGPPGGPLAGSPAAARSSWIPAPASKRLLSQGEDPLVQGGVRDRPLRRRAGPGGVSQVDGAGPATLTRSGRCRSAQAPQLLPCARRCSRRSAGRALTLRRHDKPTRSSGSHPPAPGSRTSFSNSPVRRASPVVVPGRSPASIRA